MLDQRGHREVLQGHIEQHGIVLQEVKPIPRDLGSRLEVDQVEGFAKLNMILGREIKDSGSADLADLLAFIFRQANGCIGVSQVRNTAQPVRGRMSEAQIANEPATRKNSTSMAE